MVARIRLKMGDDNMPEAAIRPQEINPARLTDVFRRQLEASNLKKGETIAIVTDLTTRREYVQAAFAAADLVGADVYELLVNQTPSWTKVGVPTIGKSKGTLEALCAVDMVMIFHIALFTGWLKQVRAAGTRVLMVHDAPDDLDELLPPPGLKAAVQYSESLYKATRKARVTRAGGTDMTWECGDFPVMAMWGQADEPGRFDIWGAGMLHTFPNEGSARGSVVIEPGDIIILPYCRYVTDPIKLQIRDGFITDVDGGLDAKLMCDWLDDNKASESDRDPYAISHLGWGLNPQARWYGMGLYGDAPERNRIATRTFAGNFLFSTGPNTQGGGKRATKGHYDVPMRDCTIELDGQTIISKGRVVDPKMIVPRVIR